MPREFRIQAANTSNASGTLRNNDGDSDPEPPIAPPVIILAKPHAKNGKAPRPTSQGQEPEAKSGPTTSPPTSLPHEQSSSSPEDNHNLRNKNNEASEPHFEPEPEPVPEPEPAPPIIILSKKRAASSSPNRSTSASLPQTPSTSPQSVMGSKVSKVTEAAQTRGKLQPAQKNTDKEEMKEPSNYYSHRSKSLRRKAGGSGGGLSDGVSGTGGGSGGGL